jgi:hypothetical protein
MLYEMFVNAYEYTVFAVDKNDMNRIIHMIGLENRPDANKIESLVHELETDEDLNMTGLVFGEDYDLVLFETKEVADIIKCLTETTEFDVKYN